MIPNGKCWNYLTLTKLSALLNKITSKHQGDFCRLNCLHSFTIENKLKSHEKYVKKRDFYGSALLTQKNNIRI